MNHAMWMADANLLEYKKNLTGLLYGQGIVGGFGVYENQLKKRNN